MPMNIPTIEITAPEFAGVIVHMASSESATIEPNNTSANAPTIYLPARMAPNCNKPSNALMQLDAYGPGSIEYKILSVVKSGDPEIPLAIDPKTFIDNYGNIHVGASNITNAGDVRKIITFNATYKYIDPSTGAYNATSLGNFKIVAAPGQLNNIQADTTAIKYQPQPGFNG